MQEMWVWSLGQEDPLKKEMATHFSIPAWKIPGTEEPGRLQFMGLQKSQTQLSYQTTMYYIINRTVFLILSIEKILLSLITSITIDRKPLTTKSVHSFYVGFYYFPVKNYLFLLPVFIQTSNRLNRMNQAAQHFLLQTVENGSWVGMVHFDSSASIRSNLIQIISSNERRKLLESLPTVASGGTSICSGIESGFQVKTILQIYFVYY